MNGKKYIKAKGAILSSTFIPRKSLGKGPG